MNKFQASTPWPVQPRGSRFFKWLLARAGWRLHFEGLPARQGVAVVYPHTSNWDFVVLILAKWALGVQASFWAKDSLFRLPLFGAWLRRVGGVPVQRTSARGVVGEMVDCFRECQAQDRYFWLGLAPEGTRKRLPGWRSGFYQLTLQSGVPLGLVRLDYKAREIRVQDFVQLSGQAALDMQGIAACFAGVQGLHPENQSPIQLLDAAYSRQDAVVK